MMNVACYICDKSCDIETELIRHLKGHTDLETQIAFQKMLKERKKCQEQEPTDTQPSQSQSPSVDSSCSTPSTEVVEKVEETPGSPLDNAKDIANL